MTEEKLVKKRAPRKKAVKKESDMIECLVIKGIAAGRPGSVVFIERHAARTLQDAGAVKVVI